MCPTTIAVSLSVRPLVLAYRSLFVVVVVYPWLSCVECYLCYLYRGGGGEGGGGDGGGGDVQLRAVVHNP